MFGTALDNIVLTFAQRTGDLPEKVDHRTMPLEGAEKWIYFVAGAQTRVPSVREVFNKKVDIDAYVVPKTIIQADPSKTRRYLENVAKEAIANNRSRKEDLNILAISGANCPAFIFANQVPVNRFVSVVPSSDLVKCMWTSEATRNMASESGRTIDDYQRELNHLSPIQNLDGLKVKKMELHLGDSDLITPYGHDLIDAMRRRGINPQVNLYKNAGHVETVFRFTPNFRDEGK